MPTKKDKEKKPRGRPRKEKKQVKQKQSQKQVVIVNVGAKGRGRPKKATAPVSMIPQTILRLNEPSVPFPLQPSVNAREPVKAIGAESVLNTLQQHYAQSYNPSENERLAQKLYEDAMKKAGREEELYPSTPFRGTLQSNEPISEGVMYPMAEAELAKQRKERSDKGKPRGPYKKKEDTPEAGLKQP